MDLTRIQDRKQLIKELKSAENRARKQESLEQFEIFSDRLHQYVKSHLLGQFSPTTVREMPIIDSINLARRIIKAEASLYKAAPKRHFTNLTKEQEEVVRYIYNSMRVDTLLMKSNECYKLQSQNLIQVVPKDGELIMRVLKGHHYDVVPKADDPEAADVFIISAFDKSYLLQDSRLNSPTGYIGTERTSNFIQSDGINQTIADPDDYKASLQRYVVWSRDFNFIMNGKGEIVSEDEATPIPGALPFVDVAGPKDFEYYIRQGNTVTDFTVQYCGALSMQAQVVKMQGFAQAVLIGPSNLMPENLQIGPNFIVKISVDENNPTAADFKFANPNPDLSGTREHLEMLLANFLSSRGLDPKMISGKAESQRFSSGVERLLSMLDRFEATREDMALYQEVERKLYDLIKLWHNTLRDTDQLRDEFKTALLPEESEVQVEYKKPEMIQTKLEKLDYNLKKLESGLISRVEILMDLEGIDREKAEEVLAAIDMDEAQGVALGQIEKPSPFPG